jgi:hypothetical protein
VERTGIFGLKWLAPAGPEGSPYEVQKLFLKRPGDLNYTLSEAGEGLRWIEVTFPAITLGATQIRFEMRREREGELVGTFDLPWFRVPSAKKDRGWIGVRTKEGYDLRLVGKPKGFEARNAAEIQAQIREPVQLGFIYNLAALEKPTQPEFQAKIEVTKRPSRVSAVVHTLVDVTDAAVSVEHAIRYDIQQAGVQKFTYSLPGWIQPAEKPKEGEEKKEGEDTKKKWEILDPEIQQKKQHTEVFDEEKERHVWTVEIQKERMGAVDLKVRYKLALTDLKPGEPVLVEIPDLQVENVFQATGYVGLKKGDNIVLSPMPGRAGKLYKADLAELQSPLKEKKPFSAFRYTEYPWGLNLGVTKYDYERALPTVVNQLHVDTVVTEEGEFRNRVLILLQNKERQSLRVRFPEGAHDILLSVDGKQERVSRTGEGDERVKLLNLTSVRGREDEFIIKIHYDIDPRTKGMKSLDILRVEVPEILGDVGEGANPPVSQLTLNLYLPPDYKYLSFRTDSMTRLTRVRGVWERIRDFFLGGGTHTQAVDIANAVKRIKHRADQKKAPGEPDFKITKNKVSAKFYKLSGGGGVSVTYMGPTLFHVLNILLLVAAVGIMVFLPFHEVAGRTQLLVLFAVGALLISALSESLTPFMGTVFIGTLCSAVFWLGYTVLVELRPMAKAKAPPGTMRPPPAPPAPPAPKPPAPPPAPPPPKAAPKKKSGAGGRKVKPKAKTSGRSSARKSARKPAQKKSGRVSKKGGGRS